MALKNQPYTGPECPRCGGWLDLDRVAPGEQRCPSCGGMFLATPFRLREARDQVESLAEAGPDGAVPCARHPGNVAEVNCSRCGVFMCALCRIEIEGQDLCPSCFDRLSSEGALATTRTRIRDFHGMAMSLSVLGLVMSCFGLLTGPATLYFVAQAARQRKLWNERGGRASLVLAALLGLAQIAIGIFVIAAMFTGISK